MAVFMLNVCKFNGCGLTFKSLGHLIQHIEETHIDYDPHVVERTEQQQPTCIPLSYALRFLTDAARKECAKSANHGRPNQASTVAAPARNRNNAATPTGSEAEEGDEYASEPDDSNDSWTTSEEFSADFILRYGSRVMNQTVPNPSNNNNIINSNSNGNNNNNNNASANNNSVDKPFACPVPGCKKRYKNVNGIKYHSKNGHKKDGKIRKAFRCPCGKSYKTPSGLKNHATIQHAGSILQNGKISSIKHDNRTSQHHHHNNNNNNRHHHHHHHHHRHQQQERENLSKNMAGAGISMKIGKHSLAKVKVAAIEDHGYIKSEKSIYASSETSMIRECEDDELGVLTPASTPPLPLQSPTKNHITPSNQQHDKTLQKYLANVAATQNNNQQRRNLADNDNAY